MSSKSEVFKSVLDGFEDEDMRLFCEDILDKQPDQNMFMPSSTSLKYHNFTQCQPGGQAYHVIMVGTIMNYLLGLEYIKDKFSKPKQRDCMRIAALCHDIDKTGGGQWTVHEHPLLAGEFICNTEVEHDIKPELKKYIARLMASHSGEWVESNRSKTVLPKPDSDDQFYVHLCDYIGSRANIDMTYDDETKNKVAEFEPTVDNYKLTFGKHSGKTLAEIQAEAPDYIEWMKTQDMKEPVKTLIKEL